MENGRIILAEEGNSPVRAEAPDILYSGRMWPCISIAFYNPFKRNGYMVHDPCFKFTNFERMVEEVLIHYSNKKDLVVFAGGNSIFSKDSKEQHKFELENRMFVQNKLEKYFDSSQLSFQWCAPDNFSELYLYLDSGEFEFRFGKVKL